MDIATLSRLIENLIRIGTVAEVDHGAWRCRVQTGELLTGWLPWFSTRAGTTRDWDSPTVGEQVMIFSPSGEPAGGIVLTGIYADAALPPSQSPNECVRKYPDGASISYNHATGHLQAIGVRTALLYATESVTIDTPHAHFTGKVTVDDLLTYKNGIAGRGGKSGNKITGSFQHTEGTLSSNGVVLDTHTHPGDSGGTTGAPNGGQQWSSV